MSRILQALYLGRRADVDDAPDDDLDVFEAAALGRHLRLAVLLGDDVAQARAWAPDGFDALQLSCFLGSPDGTALLLGAGADPDAPSRNAMATRPINAAAAGPDPVGHIRLLLAAGADPDGRQASGHTAMDEAVLRKDEALIALLREAGATG